MQRVSSLQAPEAPHLYSALPREGRRQDGRGAGRGALRRVVRGRRLGEAGGQPGTIQGGQGVHNRRAVIYFDADHVLFSWSKNKPY